MVRNAAHIILLTIFKLNDERVNDALQDVPFCTIFANMACLLRDTILELDQSHNTATTVSFNAFFGAKSTSSPPSKSGQQPSQGSQKTQPAANMITPGLLKPHSKPQVRQIDYTKMADIQEELSDLLEFLSEVYENCLHNTVVIRLLTNALLNYCLMPVVLPALIGVPRHQTIGISTALFATNAILMSLKSPQIHNIITQVLVGHKIPQQLKRALMRKEDLGDPVISYRYKWKHRLPTHYSKIKWLQEFLGKDAVRASATEFSSFLPFAAELEHKMAYQEKDEEFDLLEFLQGGYLESAELQSLEWYHFQMSKALGQPVGLCKILAERHPNKYTLESMVCKFQLFHMSLLDPFCEELQLESTSLNDFKKQFLMFLCAKDDNLMLQTSALLLTLITQSKTSQSLFYFGQFFPTGGQTIKTMLFQRLLGSSGNASNFGEQPQVAVLDSKVLAQDGDTLLERLESDFQQTLFGKLQSANCLYDQFVIGTLIRALSPDHLSFEEQMPLFRNITYRVLQTLLMTLGFNKSCAPNCLRADDSKALDLAHQQAAKNLLNIITHLPKIELAAQFVLKFKAQLTSYKPTVTFDQIAHLIKDPKIQVSSCETLPVQLRADTELETAHIQVFLGLRHLKQHLTAFSSDTSGELRKGWNPIRNVDDWTEGQSVQMPEDCELILCNTKVEKRMQVRHVMVDQDFFILVELAMNDSSMTILNRIELKALTCAVDLQEPRNLLICEQILLFFDSANKCTYVRNMLELNRQTQSRRQVQECKQYLDQLIIKN